MLLPACRSECCRTLSVNCSTGCSSVFCTSNVLETNKRAAYCTAPACFAHHASLVQLESITCDQGVNLYSSFFFSLFHRSGIQRQHQTWHQASWPDQGQISPDLLPECSWQGPLAEGVHRGTTQGDAGPAQWLWPDGVQTAGGRDIFAETAAGQTERFVYCLTLLLLLKKKKNSVRLFKKLNCWRWTFQVAWKWA